MVIESIVLGHKVSHRGIEVYKEKVSIIDKLHPSILVKAIRSFLGHTEFYRRLVKNFTLIANH